MASEHYLYCPQTQEAVEVIRRGSNGSQTPQGSAKAQFAFMSYHMGKNASFVLTALDSIGDLYEDVQVADSLAERDEEQAMHKENGGAVTMVLVWNEENAEALLSRESDQKDSLARYGFPSPVLQTVSSGDGGLASQALGQQMVDDVSQNVGPAFCDNNKPLTGRDLANQILALPESAQHRVAEIDYEGYYATETNRVISPYVDANSGNLIVGKIKTVE